MDPRSPSQMLLALALAATAMSAPARAQDSAPPTGPPTRWIERCADTPPGSTVERDQLLQMLVVRPEARALDDLDAAFGDRRVPLADLQQGLVDLLRMPCFEAAELDARIAPPAFRSRLVAEAWWREGGRRWLEQFVGRRDFSEVWVFPPGARSALTREALPNTDPLWELACSDADSRCADETRAWDVRLRGVLPRVEPQVVRARPSAWSQPDVSPGQAFIDWHDGVEWHPHEELALPLGAIRAPSNGWLIVVDVYAQVLAFDLSSSSVYIARHSAWDMDAPIEVLAGTVDRALLRELAWSMLMLSRLEGVRLGAVVSLPEGMRARYSTLHHSFTVVTTHCPAFRNYAFHWMVDGVARADYQLNTIELGWERHLLTLVEAVMSSVHRGCPRVLPNSEDLAPAAYGRPAVVEALLSRPPECRASARRAAGRAAAITPRR